MARTEDRLRQYYGEHPEGGMRCTDDECVQCEMRNMLAEISRLRELLVLAAQIIEGLVDQQAMPDDWYKEPLARIRDLRRP